MLHDVNSLNFLSAIDARYHYVRASSLMHVNILAKTLRFAGRKCLTFHGLVITELVVVLHILIIEDLLTAE